MKDLSQHYGLLSADERFRLFMAAAGRRDEQELDRLDDSCPRRTYLMDEWEYSHKKMHFMIMALHEARTVSQMEMIVCVGLISLLALDDDGERRDSIAATLGYALAQREAQIVAWERFCEQIGVDPNCVADTLGPGEGYFWPHVEQIIRSMEIDPEPDQQRVEECRRSLIEQWAQRAP